jgi:hypothetical protein
MPRMSPPLHQHSWPICMCNKNRGRVGGQERLCKLDLLNPTKDKDPCEISKIHNLSQCPFMNTFRNLLHDYGACAKSHSVLLLINIGLLHLGWVGIPIMPGPPFQNAWRCEKLKRVGNVAQGKPTLLTIAKGGWSPCWTTEKCCLKSKMSSTKHASDLKMSQYALWSTYGKARLIHSH